MEVHIDWPFLLLEGGRTFVDSELDCSAGDRDCVICFATDSRRFGTGRRVLCEKCSNLLSQVCGYRKNQTTKMGVSGGGNLRGAVLKMSMKSLLRRDSISGGIVEAIGGQGVKFE